MAGDYSRTGSALQSVEPGKVASRECTQATLLSLIEVIEQTAQGQHFATVITQDRLAQLRRDLLPLPADLRRSLDQ